MSDIPIGRAVRYLRKHRQLTIPQLVALSGVSKTNLSRIELGGRMPHLKTLIQLAAAFQVQPYKLLKLAERMGGKEDEVVA